MGDYSPYCYGVTDMYSMEGVRQFFKEWHAYAMIERSGFVNPRIVDIGCGVGEIGKMIAQNNIECDFECVDVEPRYQDPQPKGGVFHQRDLTAQSLHSFSGRSHYDIVFMYDFIQSIDPTSMECVLHELPSIIGAGGKLCIHTRNSRMIAETDAKHHLHRPDIEKLLERLNEDFIIDHVFGINYGMNEVDMPSPKTAWDHFMPDRVRRITHSLNDWYECKWVMIDATKRA